MKRIQAYGCSHCGMTSRHASSVYRHETTYCKKNPGRPNCGLCVHFERETVDFGVPEHTPHDEFYCLLLELDLEHGKRLERQDGTQFDWSPSVTTDCPHFEARNAA